MKTRELKYVYVQYFDDYDQLQHEQYLLNGKLHNECGPAVRIWNGNQQLQAEEYWLDGEMHNEFGPANKVWDENGQLSFEEYWLNGEELSKSQWVKRVYGPSYTPCDLEGQTFVINGQAYQLTKVSSDE